MSISHYYDGRLVIVTLKGSFTPQDARATLQAISADPKLRGLPVLVDARAWGDCPGTGELRKQAEQLATLSVGSQHAVVVGQGQDFGKTQTFKTLGRERGLDLEVFYDLGSALRWVWHLEGGPSGAQQRPQQVA